MLSVDLLTGAFSLLRAALADRRGLVHMTATNHNATHAPGTVVLTVTALDAWLNEALSRLCLLGEDQRKLGQRPTADKYADLMAHFCAAPSVLADLRLLSLTRDEIVHFLPRISGLPGTLPEWLTPLEKRGLLLDFAHHPVELPFRLCSYRLAYWAWTTAHAVIDDVVKAAGDSRSSFFGIGAGNFRWHLTISAPESLPQYDEKRGLKIPPTMTDDELLRAMRSTGGRTNA